MKRKLGLSALGLLLTGGLFAAPVNSWTNSNSGKWEEPYWSLGVLPNSTQSVAIYLACAGDAAEISLGRAQRRAYLRTYFW